MYCGEYCDLADVREWRVNRNKSELKSFVTLNVKVRKIHQHLPFMWLQIASRHITGVKLELASQSDGKVVETIIATPGHPFFVEGKGWSSLSALGVGTKILTRAGPAIVVKSITR